MHHVSEIKIKNFKSISNGTFPLSHYTPLVGYNNAGKTNILSAISWIIKKFSLLSSDFHDKTAPVVVEVEISGISAAVLDAIGVAHRGRIEPHIEDGRMRIRRSQTEPSQSTTNIRIEILSRENGSEVWVVNPTGIEPAILALFPDPIFIGAMENATEDVAKFGASTTIGKLLKEIMTPITDRHTGDVTAALQDIAQKLSANGIGKDPSLVELDSKIQSELTKLFPGVTAKTHIPTPEFADFMKGATIKLFEDDFESPEGRDASSFGHGAQRTIQIALIKCLSEIKRASGVNAGRTTLLLIDEPELYLHPQAIEVVRAALSRLSGEGYQVVITTHSANMIARTDAPNTLLVRRSVADGTTCYPRIKDAVTAAIADADHQSETLFALSNSSKILFSEKVAFAEGKTEKTLFPPIFQQEHGVSLDEAKIGVVDVGGVGNIPNALKVLTSMGIPCKAIADLDFAFRDAPKHGLIDSTHSGILGCMGVLKRLGDAGSIGLDASGLPVGNNGVSAAAAFELMAKQPDALPFIEQLHQMLVQKGVWIWKRGTVESHLGLSSKKSGEHFDFIKRLPDAAFRAGLPDYQSVQEALIWLRE